MKFAVSGEDVEKQNLTYALGAACSECVVERAAAKPATPSRCVLSRTETCTQVFTAAWSQQAEGRNSPSAHRLVRG